MPRKLRPEEIQTQKDYMYKKTVNLIIEKGIQNLTLEDILQAVHMAKGSFYRYYHSKEEFLYEVFKRNEAHYFELLINAEGTFPIDSESIHHVLNSTIFSEECLFPYLLPEDQEYLLHRLPEKFLEQEKSKSENNFKLIAKVLRMRQTEETYSTLSYLMDGLQTIFRSPTHYGEAGRKIAINWMIDTISKYILSERADHEKE